MCWVGFFLTVFPSITTRRLSPFRKLSTSSWSLFLFAWSWKSPLTLSPWLWPCWSGTHQCKDAHTWCIQGAQVYNKTMPRLERATLIDFALWLCTLVFIVRLLCQLQIAGLLNQFEELKIWVQIVPLSFPSFTSRSGMWSRMFHISTMCSMIVDFEVLARTLGGLVLESMGVDHLLICRKTMDSFAWLASPCRYTCFSTTGPIIMHIKVDNDNWTLSSWQPWHDSREVWVRGGHSAQPLHHWHHCGRRHCHRWRHLIREQMPLKPSLQEGQWWLWP